jgi:3-hydroxybutyrate dehydrogenase
MLDVKLTGKNAIITGSTSGIGEGIAKAYAAQGCNVMIHGFGDQKVIDALCQEIRDTYKVKVAFSGADVSKQEPIAQMITQAEKELGNVDILVNNAGIQFTSNTEEFPIEKWDAIIATNLSSAFLASRLVIPSMKKRGYGRIINTASVHGLVASAHKSAYVAAKHGVVGLTKTIALETAGSGITCNSICPGWVLTPLVQKQIDDKAKAENITPEKAKLDLVAAKQPSKQFVTVEELGALAVFLASDFAAQITGASIPVDGGWTAQ